MCDNNGVIAVYNKKIYNKYILFVPQISINSYPSENKCQKEREWKKGDFLIHFAGMHSHELYFKYVKIASEIRNDLNDFDTSNWLKIINQYTKKKHNLSIINFLL
jgi:hypothetical protein